MRQLTPEQLADIQGGGSRNCGNTWQTYWVTTTCSVAGGMIGLAGGPLGSSLGSLLGKMACTWVCYYAS